MSILLIRSDSSTAASLLSDVPLPLPGDLGNWLFSATCILTFILLVKTGFTRKPAIEAEFATKTELIAHKTDIQARLDTHQSEDKEEFAALRDRMDIRQNILLEKLDEMRADINAHGERRSIALHERINDLAAGLARVDERTK